MTRLAVGRPTLAILPQNSTRRISESLKTKSFFGGVEVACPQTSLVGTLHMLSWLRFAKYSNQVHTGTPLFKILDLPLQYKTECQQIFFLSATGDWTSGRAGKQIL